MNDPFDLNSAAQSQAERLMIGRCLVGDEAGSTQLVDGYLQDVFRVCLTILGNQHDAEDATQDTFVRVFRFLEKWDGRPLKPWILTIAANVCRSRLKSCRLTQELPLQLAQPPEKDQADWENIPILDGAIAQGLKTLRDEYRLVLVLHHQLHQPVERVSQMLEKPIGTVKTWLARGRQALWTWLVSNDHVTVSAPSSAREEN